MFGFHLPFQIPVLEYQLSGTASNFFRSREGVDKKLRLKRETRIMGPSRPAPAPVGLMLRPWRPHHSPLLSLPFDPSVSAALMADPNDLHSSFSDLGRREPDNVKSLTTRFFVDLFLNYTDMATIC